MDGQVGQHLHLVVTQINVRDSGPSQCVTSDGRDAVPPQVQQPKSPEVEVLQPRERGDPVVGKVQAFQGGQNLAVIEICYI